MYTNLNNTCIFEGRICRDIEYSQVNTQKGAMDKVKFTIAVDKIMTVAQKQTAKTNNQPTADFIPCECIGAKASFINRFFGKGKAIKVMAAFKSFNYLDSNGNKVYSYTFEVVDAGFTAQDAQGSAGQNNNNNGGNFNSFNNAPSNNHDMMPIDDGDIPF